MQRLVPLPCRDGNAFMLLCGVLVLTLQMVFANPAGAATQIWSQRDEFVRIEPQDDRTAPENDHPVKISGQQISELLSSVKVDFPGEDESGPVPVFTREEIDTLGRTLSEGLARADAHQDVSFQTIGSHKFAGFLGKRLVNTGRVFYREGRLNLILGEVHGDYRKKNLYGQRGEDYRPRRYASRTEPAEGDWKLVEFGGAEHYVRDGTERRDWLQLDPQRITAGGAPPVESAAPLRVVQLQAEATGGPAASAEERLAVLKDLRTQDLISEELYQSKMAAILDTEVGTPSASFEQRLRTLKELRRKDLIPEATYRARVEAIVNEL